MIISNSIRTISALLFAFALLVLVLAPSAQAQTQSPKEVHDAVPPVDILPAMTISHDVDLPTDAEETHPPVRLTPDKSEIIRLERESRTIIVGNPEHLSVLADTSKTLILVPRVPGATHFTVLDGHGEVIMQRHVIVASPKERYIRIRRSCAKSEDKNCKETSVFFCPDMCHKVNVVATESEANDSVFDEIEKMAEAAAENNDDDGAPTEEPAP
ncbi:MAG: hypothetical protein DHS20C02_08330 [Micavibrio sp.]|nr:MAG: hypothetical protein DHS20C02_08330 [Micavibrio sp.]